MWTTLVKGSSSQGTHGTGKQGKWPKKIPVSENTGNLEMSKHRENTGNFVSSSCKCSDSKSKGYCNSCRKKIYFFPPEPGYFCQVSSVYLILTNYVNWHREILRTDRENTGNLKIQFEWVPCLLENKYLGPRLGVLMSHVDF